MNLVARLACAFLLLILSACQSPLTDLKPPIQGGAVGPKPVHSEEDLSAIRLIVLKTLLQRSAKTEKRPIFVSIEHEADPPSDLLSELKKENPNVRVFSRCRIEGYAYDKATAERGRAIYLISITFETPRRAKVGTWLFWSMTAGAGFTYEVEKIKNSWHIEHIEPGPVA
jgi:hypothetical protein